MNIFILEDNFIQQTRIESLCHELLKQNGWDCRQLEVYGKPHQLLEAITERGGHQLFLLDIEIKGEEKKGLDIARDIRERDPHAVIVFVTTHSEFMPISFQYQVSALDFIDKELDERQFRERIEKAISYVYHNQGKTLAEDSFYFKSKYAQVQYPFSDVYYIETSSRPHRVILYTKTDRMEFTASLSDILKQEKRLLQCHRSFAINPTNIVKIDRKDRVAYFPNGASCFISRLNLGRVLAAVEKHH